MTTTLLLGSGFVEGPMVHDHQFGASYVTVQDSSQISNAFQKRNLCYVPGNIFVKTKTALQIMSNTSCIIAGLSWPTAISRSAVVTLPATFAHTVKDHHSPLTLSAGGARAYIPALI